MKKQITIIEKMKAVVKNLPASGYKMGDLFTLTVGELQVKHDARQYYSGRGGKYNKGVKHGDIDVVMTEKELSKAYKPISEKINEQLKRDKQQALYLKRCNTPSFICEELKKRVDIISDLGDPGVDFEGKPLQYYINGYHGCGVYRLAIHNGKIVATIKGGYFDSAPFMTDKSKWAKAINEYLKEKLGESFNVVKADGSGCMFFLRYGEDAHLLPTKEYNVPSTYGGVHHNIEVL